MTTQPDIGTAVNRVDGVMKVTGQAVYAGEHPARDLLYGVAVSAGITCGRITSIDTSQALEAARRGAMLVTASYQDASHNTRLETALAHRFTPKEKKKGNSIKGDVDATCAHATAKIEQRYHLAMEHHHPMEMHATTVQWHEDGTITVYDKNQGSQNAQEQLARAFGYTAETLRVINTFVGGAFGSGLRPSAPDKYSWINLSLNGSSYFLAIKTLWRGDKKLDTKLR